MSCVRCEITRAKLYAMFLYHVQKMSREQTALQVIASDKFTGVYWLKDDTIYRSASITLFLTGIGAEVVKLNRT